jgi:hypothetical protein
MVFLKIFLENFSGIPNDRFPRLNAKNALVNSAAFFPLFRLIQPALGVNPFLWKMRRDKTDHALYE